MKTRTSRFISSLIILLLVTLFSLHVVSAEKNGKQTQDKTSYIDVSVATLWSEPNKIRPIDGPSASNPVDMWKWTQNMSVDEKLWLVGNLQTQALYGQEVTILEEQGEWVKVAVHGQSTPKNDLGYPAWMPKEQLADEKMFSTMQENKPFALITDPTAWLYDDKNKKDKFKEVSFHTRLPVITETGSFTLVATPSDGMKWVSSESIAIYDSQQDIPHPTGEDLVNTAEQFLGLPYLWAGTSGFGFDCSGFTHTIYKAHGISLPRDSTVQAENGAPVEKEDLQKGDLLFFAYEEGEGAVHHVGMYIGDGKMIHAPNSNSAVEIIKVSESDSYSSEYAGARRYIE